MNARTRAELLTQLAKISEKELDVENLSDEELLQNLGFDSLSAIMLILRLEECYGIEVTGDELASLDSIGSLLALLDSKRVSEHPRGTAQHSAPTAQGDVEPEPGAGDVPVADGELVPAPSLTEP